MSTVLVFAGGRRLDAPTVARLPMASLVIAADSGADRALEIGIRPDVVVGDLDSVSIDTLAELRVDPEVEIDEHPTAKDETDLELAMLRALTAEPERIVVTGLDGGRPDHQLANLLLLADARWRDVTVDAELEGASVRVVHDRRQLDAPAGALVSLLPVGGDALGVTTGGLAFPLAGETLPAGTPRGISNVVEVADPTVAVERGTLVAMVVRGLT